MAVLVGAAVDTEAHLENSLPHLLSQTLVLTRRLLIRWVRNPMAIVHALLLPVAFLLTLKLVFADSITSITGQNALYRSVPLVALLAGMAGSSAGVVGITTEHLDGFLARLWAMPIIVPPDCCRGWPRRRYACWARRWSSWARESFSGSASTAGRPAHCCGLPFR